jgi:hypothetical protein
MAVAGGQENQAASDGSRPQIAYRLFSTWADGYNHDVTSGKQIASTVLVSMGGLGLVAAGATWYWGDDVSRSMIGSPMDPNVKQGIILGSGIGGLALVITGAAVGSMKVPDQRAVYADIFDERDPEVQEAMAVAALRDQATRGKERRITSFVSSLVVPLVTGGIKVGINLASGETWSKDVLSSLGYSSWSMTSGIMALFSKSKEELLYDRYLTTRDSLYGSPVGAP